uniref:Uncharacterized protein n=1 Tax=Glossina palpalis gambiensis TaxID=67801 RepID=A0A1B0C6W0_9MUSC
MKNFKTLTNKFFSLHKNSSIFHRTLIRTLRIVEQQQFLLRNKSFLFSNIIQYKGIENVLSPREMMFIWSYLVPKRTVTTSLSNAHQNGKHLLKIIILKIGSRSYMILILIIGKACLQFSIPFSLMYYVLYTMCVCILYINYYVFHVIYVVYYKSLHYHFIFTDFTKKSGRVGCPEKSKNTKKKYSSLSLLGVTDSATLLHY